MLELLLQFVCCLMCMVLRPFFGRQSVGNWSSQATQAGRRFAVPFVDRLVNEMWQFAETRRNGPGRKLSGARAHPSTSAYHIVKSALRNPMGCFSRDAIPARNPGSKSTISLVR